jgi:hypothetical protein
MTKDRCPTCGRIWHSPGRELSLTLEQVRKLDAWHAQPRKKKRPPFKTMAYRYGVSAQTLQNAVHRKGAYARFPR